MVLFSKCCLSTTRKPLILRYKAHKVNKASVKLVLYPSETAVHNNLFRLQYSYSL